MKGMHYTMMQNMAGLDKMSLGQTSRIRAKIRAGLRNVRTEAGKTGAYVEKSVQKLEALAAQRGQGGATLCTQMRNNKGVMKKTMPLKTT